MDIDEMISMLWSHQMLEESDLVALLLKAREILIEENNVLYLTSPVTVCGDIHGQFHDLLTLFKTGGKPPDTSYIFLGDYVDRGIASVETLSLLVAYKVKYPALITLLRGNHECRQVTQIYGFHDEIVRKYGKSLVWRMATELFDCLPISVVINNQILCVHGGLSPDVQSIDQISSLQRLRETPQIGALADLLWSDPDESIQNWNCSTRGAGYCFGTRVVQEFCHLNGLSLICRAHQLERKGYRYWFDHKLILTIWSAPNYAYREKNEAAIIAFDEELVAEPKVFQHDVVGHQEAQQGIRKKPMYFL